MNGLYDKVDARTFGFGKSIQLPAVEGIRESLLEFFRMSPFGKWEFDESVCSAAARLHFRRGNWIEKSDNLVPAGFAALLECTTQTTHEQLRITLTFSTFIKGPILRKDQRLWKRRCSRYNALEIESLRNYLREWFDLESLPGIGEAQS